MKNNLVPLLLGRDLRSVGRVNEVVRLVDDQQTFDELFKLLFHHERLLVMRAADAVEKITMSHYEWLMPHKDQLFGLLRSAVHKELKWHLPLLIVRLKLTPDEKADAWGILSYWVRNRNESRIVRVNSLQGLFELSVGSKEMGEAFVDIVYELEHERIPSLLARIKKLKKRAGIK